MSSTILCIDDDRALAGVLEAGTPAGEICVLHTSDPEQALRLALEKRPDLVLIDLALAGGDGLDLVDRLREQSGPVSSVPVVAITRGERTSEALARAVELGVEDLLEGPVSDKQLAECVRDTLARSKSVLPADLAVEGPSDEGLSSGKLEDLPLPEVLQRLHHQGRSGVLIVGDSQERTGIQIRNGSPVAIGLNGPETIEDYLVRTERISAFDRDRAQNEIALGLSTAEDVLLGMGVIDEAGFEEAARERAEEGLFHLFEREHGRYRFERGRRLKSDKSVDVQRSAESIIVRGVLAWSSFATVRAALERYADLYAVAGARPPTSADIPCSPAQREFIASLSGDRSVGDFLEAGEFEQRTLYAFAIVGAIDLCMLMLEDVLEEAPPPEPASQRTAAGRRREAPAADLEADLGAPAADLQSPAADLEAPDLEVTAADLEAAAPDLEMTGADLDAPALDLEAPDLEAPAADLEVPAPDLEALEAPAPDLEVLEAPAPDLEVPAPEPAEREATLADAEAPVPVSAGPETVAPAEGQDFKGELAVIPPPAPAGTPGGEDRRLAVLPFASLRQDASELEALTRRVRTRLARTLGDRLKDDSSDSQAEPGVDPSLGDSASRALDAESWFRKGQDLLKTRKYSEAVEAFGMSAHLDPTEGEYVSHLGYALYLSKPDDELVRKEALEDIARGIKLSPDRETGYVFMGRIFKVMGDIDVARKMFSRALVIRPHCREASQELRLIEMREKKAGGFLSRLRR